MATKTVAHEVNGLEVVTQLPAMWQICDHCDGEGKSSSYLGAFTRADMDEEGPEFMQDYMSGAYDRPCSCCDGRGSVLVVDVARCKTLEYRRALRWLRESARDAYEDEAARRAEMRLCGDYA